MIPGLFLLAILGHATLMAQVQFPQKLDADFHKGHYNDLIVAGNKVSVPLQATHADNQWLTTTVLPQTLSGHKAATWNNRFVYVSGGFNEVTYSNAVYRATLQASGIGSYTTLNPLPVALKDHAMVIGTNAIYVLGGRNDTGMFNTIYHAEISSDGATGEWVESGVSLPEALWGHTAVYCNGYIYVAGGAQNTTATTARNNVYVAQVLADNSLSEFTAVADLPQPRNGHSMLVHNDKMYVLGGFNNGGIKQNTVYVATSGNDGELGGWSAATALPVAVSNHSSVIINGLISVLAGETAGGLTRNVYWADVTAETLNWNLSPNLMYDLTKNGAAFASNGQIAYCGGENPSGTPIHNTRYTNLTLSSDHKATGLFVSNPFFELGAERLITELTFDVSAPDGSAIGISYRTAGADKIWGNWTAATSESPIPVNETKQYLQYKVLFESDGTAKPEFDEMKLFTPGTQLQGNLNDWGGLFTEAESPYWATHDISFTAGTHVFEAGTEILFLPGVMMTVGQASIICNGTAEKPVKFMGYTDVNGLWNGIYFDPQSDQGVSSQFNHVIIKHGGNGANAANLYCNGTNEPLIQNSIISNSSANGIRLNNAHINLEATEIRNNAGNAVHLTNSNPTFIDCLLTENGEAGVYLSSTDSEPNYTNTTISENLYGMRYPSPNFTFYEPYGTPEMINNYYNGIAINGGDVTGSDRVWNPISYDLIMLGDLNIGHHNNRRRLTIEPGNTIRFVEEARLNVGRLGSSDRGGELYAIGTADSLITFTAFDGNRGSWEGIRFSPQSNLHGNSSVMDYCVVEKGSEYNIYVQNSYVQLKNSTIQLADIDGIRFLNSGGDIENNSFLNNGRYPMYFMDWQCNPFYQDNTYSGNTLNYIALSGGQYNEDRTLYYDGVPYHVLDDIILARFSNIMTLTVEPGVTLYFDQLKQLYVGGTQSSGSLIAEGTGELPITFTSYNGESGGWEGLYFSSRSDSYGNASSLRHCIIENGNDFNVFSESTDQPVIENSIIRNAALDGIRLQNSSMTFNDCEFIDNGAYPIRFLNWQCSPSYQGNTYSGNTLNYIALSGGQYNEDRTLYYDGVPYHVLDDIILARFSNIMTLTVEPGVTLYFDQLKQLYVGGTQSSGSLIAEGTEELPITFTSYNGETGGWEGLYFSSRSDSYGNASSLRHCIIENGNDFNIFSESTDQPVIENSIIRNAAVDGIWLQSSSMTFNDCEFIDNGAYPIRFLNWESSPSHQGNTYSGNTLNYIALSGGNYNADRTLYYDGVPYHVLDDIILARFSNIMTLIVEPGVTLYFDQLKQLYVGGTQSSGSLIAEGTEELPITFTSFNGETGGWEGLYFSSRSDSYGNASSLRHCIIENGNDFNIFSESTDQPVIENSIIRNAALDGITLTNAFITISNSSVMLNGLHGIFINGTSNPTIGNQPQYANSFLYNGGYAVYNNTANDINARYNYWGTGDANLVALSIYDQRNNSDKGIVHFMDFAKLPALTTAETTMSGWVKYASDAATAMPNAEMVISEFDGVGVATATTNNDGIYDFAAFASGSYHMAITPEAPWGGANATDALNILRHFAQIEPLTGINMAAADVNQSLTVNATDALLVMKRYAGMIDSFVAGDYLFHSDTVIINGDHVTNNMLIRSFGDVNGSYEIDKNASGAVSLVYDGSIDIASFTEFDLPVTLKTGQHLGAISLGFHYPEEYLELLDVELHNGAGGYLHHDEDGLVRLAWCSLDPMYVDGGKVLATLKMRALDLAGLHTPIMLELYQHVEFADQHGQPFPITVLEIPELLTGTTDLGPDFQTGGFSVYPNPVPTGSASILGFYLTNDSKIGVEVYNYLGQQVISVPGQWYPAGNNEITIDAASLAPGMYMLRVSSNDSHETGVHVIRMVIAN